MAVIHPKRRKNLNQQLKLSTTRVPLFIYVGKGSAEAIEAYAMGGAITKKGVEIFVNDKLKTNEVCMIAFQNKDNQPFRTVVAWCRSIKEKRTGHIKGAQWQAGLRYEFASQDEAKRYGEFLQSLREDVAAKSRPDRSQPTMVEAAEETFEWDDDDVA